MALAMLCITCFTLAGVSEVTAEVTQTDGEEITEDIYVDITAHQMFYNALFQQQVEEGKMDDQEWAGEMMKKMDEVYEAHGVTEEAYAEYHEDIMEDPDKYLSLMGTINERVEELSKEYEQE